MPAHSLLEIHVVKGKLNKKCDSLSRFVVDGGKRGHSSTHSNTTEPHWNHSSGFILDESKHEIEIVVKEVHSFGSKSTLGTAKVPFPPLSPKQKNVKLELDNKAGFIYCNITYTEKPKEMNTAKDYMDTFTIGVECKINGKARIFDCSSNRAILRTHKEASPNKYKLYLVDDIREVRDGIDGENKEKAITIIHGRKFVNVEIIFNNTDDKHFTQLALKHLVENWKKVKPTMAGNTWLLYLWHEFDQDGSGHLQKSEMREIMHHINKEMSADESRALFKKVQSEENPSKDLDYYEFVDLFCKLAEREEVEELYWKYTKGVIMSVEEFQIFLKKMQNQNFDIEKCKELCVRFNTMGEAGLCLTNDSMALLPTPANDSITFDGFYAFMESDENLLIEPSHLSVYQDMNQPLSHYWINSSHNTYLLEDQLKGPSSVEAYIRALRSGCRCVELDCWDGEDGEPVIYHGYTLTSKILFKDVIQCIREHSFFASPYPVILSFENHCSHDQQIKMAEYVKTILGDMLYCEPPDENSTHLPSPEFFKNKILIKGKKSTINTEVVDSVEDESDEAAECEGVSVDDKKPKPKVAQELSDIVSHIQGVHFDNFESSKTNAKYYQMSSFAEGKTESLAETQKTEWIEYNTRQLSRIYPGGGRVDSSNYDPMLGFDCGSQIVALNYQTGDKGMQILRGRFQVNGNCGYTLKPAFMRTLPMPKPEGEFTLKFSVISANRLPKPKGEVGSEVIDPLVEVELCSHGYGEGRKSRSKHIDSNGYHPVWNFKAEFKLNSHQMETAIIRFAIYDDDFGRDDFIAYATLPVSSMREGYRTVHLVYADGREVLYSNLFVKCEIEKH